jgi:hypothetical protein
MKLLQSLQALRDAVKPVSVPVKSLGKNIELLPLFVSQRIQLITNSKSENERAYALLLVALSLYENGKRLSDDMNIDELIGYIDPLPEDDMLKLFDAATELSKVTITDVEDAQKN